MVSIGTLVAFITVADRRDHSAASANPTCPVASGFPLLSGDTHPVGAACLWIILYGLPRNTWIWFSDMGGVVLIFYFLWSRRHSALNDGGDGLIPTAAPTEDEVLVPPDEFTPPKEAP